jgi:hypothetical protein
MSRRELCLASLLLAILAAIIFATHYLHGALYLDDFSNAAQTLHSPHGPGLGHVLGHFVDVTLYRPMLVLYVPLTFIVLGANATAQLAWATALAVFVAVCVYGILRALDVPRLHSWVLAGLTLAYPWYDSLRMWSTASQASLSITFALGGFWTALVGLRRNAWRWHAGAAALYLLSVLTYEVTIPAILGAGLVYVARVAWRSAYRRWLTDIVVVAIGTAWVYGLESHQSFGLAADLRHAREIGGAGVSMIGRSIVAVGLQPHTAIAIAALVVVLGLGLTMLTRHRPNPTREGWTSAVGCGWPPAGSVSQH